MKKIILFLIVIICIISIFIYNYRKPRGYEISYELNGFNVSEKYDSEDKYYYFKFVKDEYTYEYNLDIEYSSSRRIVDNIEIEESDNILCIKPKIKNTRDLDFICYNGNVYVNETIGLNKKVDDSKKINDYNNIAIYDKDKDFLIWNNLGFTNINTKKDYKFLEKETYDNPLSYIYKEYIIVADYDSDHTFSKFYIYDNKKEKVTDFSFDYKISFDSYFMGDYEGNIYLFDKKNKVQYKINIDNKKITKSNDSEGAFYYDQKSDTMALNKLAYNVYTFNYDNQYNFKLDNNTLLMNYHNSKINIKVSDKKVTSILYQTYDTVYYLVEEKLYSYRVGAAEKLLLKNFEWNFSYLNKIYIFD